MKKIICTISMVVILFNFIFCNSVYAEYAAKFQGIDSVQPDTITGKDQEGLANEGKVENDSMGPMDLVWGILGSVFGAISGIIAAVLNLFPMLMQLVMSILVEKGFSIENAAFNLIPMFSINYFDFGENYKVGNIELKNEGEILTLRGSIAEWFYVIRLISIAVSLLVLIYVGIRMALSTLAADKARYKKMFMGWAESIIILFLMQYIISFLFFLGEKFGSIVYDLKVIMDANGEISFEQDIMNSMFSFMAITSGWEYTLYSIMYWVLIFVQTKFFVLYFRRVVVVGFLIIIAPAVTITYPIDKAGDGKAQAFTAWFSELLVNIMIQPIHAIIYLVFMYTAGEIAKQSMLVGLIFLLNITKVEKYVLKLFNLKNVVSMKSVDEERKKGI